MENFFKFFSNIFSNSNKEEENKLDNEIFLSNIQYSFKMKKNRKVNSFININKEKCPKCSSKFLSKKYCHFHSDKNIIEGIDKINNSKLNYDKNILSNDNNKQQKFWDNINISPIKKDNKVKFENNQNMNINNNNSSGINKDLFKEEPNKKIDVIHLQIINEEDENIFKFFYNYAITKNNYINYPFFDFINFKKFLFCIRGDDDSNGYKEIKELVLNHFLSLLLINNFIQLIENRLFDSFENNECELYPNIKFIIINDINEINNFSESHFFKIKNFEMIMLIIHYSNWNIILLDKINFNAIFFLYEPFENINEEISLKILFKITQLYDKNIKWKLKALNYFSNECYHEIYTLIAMDYYSRGILNIPIFSKYDLEYYAILISVELLNGILYTCNN
jgi:hypothetical protein